MSSVRMCDNCGAIFSENARGWQRGTISEMDDDGNMVKVSQDRCPECSVGGLKRAEYPTFKPDRPVTQLGQDPRLTSAGVAAPLPIEGEVAK
jgi:hypothetical protein